MLRIFILRDLPAFWPKASTRQSFRYFSTNEDDVKSKNEPNLSDVHTYETVSEPGSLVKTTIIKRNPILKEEKTTEDILEEAAKKIAEKPSDVEFKDNVKFINFAEVFAVKLEPPNPILCFEDDDIYSEIEKPCVNRHAISSLFTYDIFEDIQERLDEAQKNQKEITEKNEEVISKPPDESQTENEPIVDKNTEKLQKILSLSSNYPNFLRYLGFIPFGSLFFNKQWWKFRFRPNFIYIKLKNFIYFINY